MPDQEAPLSVEQLKGGGGGGEREAAVGGWCSVLLIWTYFNTVLLI